MKDITEFFMDQTDQPFDFDHKIDWIANLPNLLDPSKGTDELTEQDIIDLWTNQGIGVDVLVGTSSPEPGEVIDHINGHAGYDGSIPDKLIYQLVPTTNNKYKVVRPNPQEIKDKLSEDIYDLVHKKRQPRNPDELENKLERFKELTGRKPGFSESKIHKLSNLIN